LLLPTRDIVGISAFVTALALATRSSCCDLFDFDPEVERTLHTRRRAIQVNTASTIDPDFDHDYSDYMHSLLDSDSELVGEIMGDQRTLRELAAPDVNYNSYCIEYPEAVAPFELKSGLIHLLPKFNSLAGEDPHKHLTEFQNNNGILTPNRQIPLFSIFYELFTVFIVSKNSKKNSHNYYSA